MTRNGHSEEKQTTVGQPGDQEESATRKRLFLSALEVFSRKGFQAATVREICSRAGQANLSAVNYHFGGKRRLYESILEMLFAELGKRMEGLERSAADADPETRLAAFVRLYTDMLFEGGETGEQFLRIYAMELVNPSPYFDVMAYRHVRPQTLAIMDLVRGVLGDGAPEDLVRDMASSVASQIAYPAIAWPLYRRVFPDHPGLAAHRETFAERVACFSLAGLRAMRSEIEQTR